MCALIATDTRLKTTSGGPLQGTESSATGGVRYVVDSVKAPNRILVIQDSTDGREPKAP